MAANGRRAGPSATAVVRRAREQLAEITGRDTEAVLGFERDEEGWRVRLEVLELERVPNTMDVLGCYEVVLDHHGRLVRADRTGRYHRAEVSDGR
jgi:hypothetical protein